MCLVFGENHGKLEMKKNTVIGRHFFFYSKLLLERVFKK